MKQAQLHCSVSNNNTNNLTWHTSVNMAFTAVWGIPTSVKSPMQMNVQTLRQMWLKSVHVCLKSKNSWSLSCSLATMLVGFLSVCPHAPQKRSGDSAHLSGLKTDSLKGSKSQVVHVGELSEPADDAEKEFIYLNIPICGMTYNKMRKVLWRLTASPSCTWLPVGSVESRECRNKVTTVRWPGCCC